MTTILICILYVIGGLLIAYKLNKKRKVKNNGLRSIRNRNISNL